MAHIRLDSPLGPLTVFEEMGAVVALEWALERGSAAEGSETPLLTKARNQLGAYFDGRLTRFDLPLRPAGTAFQKSVWKLMDEIPFGALRTYGDLAVDLGSAPRAVGGACGRNPIPIIIPCHRVVGTGGLGGYTGLGRVDTKGALLRLEGAVD